MLLHSALQLIKPSSHLADMESAESGQARWSWGWQGDKSKWERRRGSGEVANSSTVNSSKQVNAETREQPNKERGHCFSLPGGPAARTHRPRRRSRLSSSHRPAQERMLTPERNLGLEPTFASRPRMCVPLPVPLANV